MAAVNLKRHVQITDFSTSLPYTGENIGLSPVLNHSFGQIFGLWSMNKDPSKHDAVRQYYKNLQRRYVGMYHNFQVAVPGNCVDNPYTQCEEDFTESNFIHDQGQRRTNDSGHYILDLSSRDTRIRIAVATERIITNAKDAGMCYTHLSLDNCCFGSSTLYIPPNLIDDIPAFKTILKNQINLLHNIAVGCGWQGAVPNIGWNPASANASDAWTYVNQLYCKMVLVEWPFGSDGQFDFADTITAYQDWLNADSDRILLLMAKANSDAPYTCKSDATVNREFARLAQLYEPNRVFFKMVNHLMHSYTQPHETCETCGWDRVHNGVWYYAAQQMMTWPIFYRLGNPVGSSEKISDDTWKRTFTNGYVTFTYSDSEPYGEGQIHLND